MVVRECMGPEGVRCVGVFWCVLWRHISIKHLLLMEKKPVIVKDLVIPKKPVQKQKMPFIKDVKSIVCTPCTCSLLANKWQTLLGTVDCNDTDNILRAWNKVGECDRVSWWRNSLFFGTHITTFQLVANLIASDCSTRGIPVHSKGVCGDLREVNSSWWIKCYSTERTDH